MYYSKFSGSEIPNASNDRHIENKLDDLTFKTDFHYVLSDRNEYYGGVKINFIKTRLLLSNSAGQLNDMGSEATAFGGYAGFRLLNIDGLKADLGSRLNILRLTEGPSLFFEPRMNVVYSVLPTLNVKAAWGIYQQQLVTISDEDEVFALFEPWMITPDYLRVSSAIHYIGGLDYYLTADFEIDAEGYYKAMHNLALVNDELIYPDDKQLVNANGESHGAEIAMNYKTEQIFAQMSYSYSWTTRTLRGIEYHPRYDSRNAVKFFVNSDLGNNWNASVTWSYNSGMPFTQIIGYYNKFNSSDILTSTSPLTDYSYFPILADRNAAQLPDYHRLDMSVSKRIHVWSMDVTIDVNLINVYDRKNFFYFDAKTGERVNMLPFFPSVDVKVEL
jgi:hypothetical protein